MISKKDVIKRLSSLANRGAGTESEAAASDIIASEFKSTGLNPTIERFKTQTSMPIIHLAHFLSLFLISTVINFYPLAGSIIGLVIIISFWGEFTYHFFIIRHLIPKKWSQNVVARFGKSDAKIKVVISAHIDAARGGFIFSPIFANATAMSKKQPLHKTLLTFMIFLTLVFIIKAFGGGTWLLSIIFNVIAVLALGASILMLQWEFSPYTAGANDDLSGVITVLGIAEKVARENYNDIEFYFLVTGAEESHCNGMRAFLRHHKDEVDKDTAYFINIECVGGGKLKYVTEEGFIVMQQHHHTLIQLCETVARKYRLDFQPAVTVAHSDSIVPLASGYKSIGIIALNEYYLPTNYHTRKDTEENLDYKVIDEAEDTILKIVSMIKEFRERGYI